MDTDEFFNWMAFDMLKNEKFKSKVEKQRSREMSDEERSKAIKDMFASIRGNN